MVAIEHPEVIEGWRRIIDTDVIGSEDSAEDDSIHNDGVALDEEYESCLVDACVITGVTQSGIEVVEYV